MQWFIKIVVALAKVYTDQAILDAENIHRGTIVLWWGAKVDIPDGWIPCLGDDGAPDLRDKFIYCVGLTSAPGQTGGTVSHTHATGTGLSAGKIRTASATHIPPFHRLWYIMKT